MKPALILIGTVLTIAYFVSKKKEEERQLPQAQSLQAFDLLKQAAQ